MNGGGRRTRTPLANGDIDLARAAARRHATGALGLAPSTLQHDRYGLRDFVEWLDLSQIDVEDDFDDAVFAAYAEHRHLAGVPPKRIRAAFAGLGRHFSPETLAAGRTVHHNHVRRVGLPQTRRGQAPVYAAETLALISEELGVVADDHAVIHARFVLAVAIPWPTRDRGRLVAAHLEFRPDGLLVHPPPGCDHLPVLVTPSADPLLCAVSAARTLQRLRSGPLIDKPFRSRLRGYRHADLGLHLPVAARSSEHLRVFAEIAHRIAWPIRIAARNRAHFNLSYATAIRYSGGRRMQLDHVKKQSDGTWLVHQPHSKWNQRGDPDDFVLEPRDDGLDPIAPLIEWLTVRPVGDGALFADVMDRGDAGPPLMGLKFAGYKYHWNEAMARLVSRGALPEIVRLTSHSLRRSRATHAWNATGDLGAVALLLGHRNLASTWTYLTEANPFFNNAASALMQNRKGA